MITFDETNHVFHLKNDRFSYCFSIERGKYLLHQYFGRPLRAFRGSAERPALGLYGSSPQLLRQAEALRCCSRCFRMRPAV